MASCLNVDPEQTPDTTSALHGAAKIQAPDVGANQIAALDVHFSNHALSITEKATFVNLYKRNYPNAIKTNEAIRKMKQATISHMPNGICFAFFLHTANHKTRIRSARGQAMRVKYIK